MAWTQTQLDALKDAYARGVTTVHDGTKTIVYASLDDLYQAIQRIERALTAQSARYSHAVVRFRTRFGGGY